MPTPEELFLADTFVASELDRALAPFLDLLDADELAWMRETLAVELSEDAALQGLLLAAYPQTVEASGERLKPWFEREELSDSKKVG